MTNHPNRKPPPTAQPLRMTPQQLTDICDRSGLPRQQLAELAGVSLRTLQQYEAGRAIPMSVSGLLCLSLIVLGGPAGLLAPWLRHDVADAAGRLRFAAATAPGNRTSAAMDRAIAMVRAGSTPADAERECGVSTRGLRDALRKAGFAPKPVGRPTKKASNSPCIMGA